MELDLRLGQIRRLLGQIRVANLRLGGLEVGQLGIREVDRVGEVVLTDTDLRLRIAQFLDGGSERVNATRRQLATPARPTNVYPVARQDMVVGIQGPGIQTLLRQICSVDFVPLFASSGPASGPIVLTSMVGVGVVAWPRRTEGGPALRVWLDPSFAHYFWTTLLEVGGGVGALVIGSNT